ncbi:hypothetical protein EIN_046850 [Entamoeba invadens IP1]|uniref:START domain-containing protein n=1 Tax=Entamoeba invadens IP1 TaxID=370355 RepID=A0A0A1UG52_ENTIV|nr:hypothetical protein EIN_046850 [Entamoeba invadens IP1]ELP94422.1 hypothetical protein EIN_046850 [Entamoeba invadens IP1]|eukprot:XP_004261193.1 hypothetical protein EIN_046850 [Entamoeba invadens IP1]
MAEDEAHEAYTKSVIMDFKKAAESQDGWKQIYRTDDVMVLTQKTEGSIVKFKCITKQVKDAEPEYVFSSLCDREYLATKESNDLKFDVVDKIDCCNEVIHRVQKMPLMDDRDFVYQLIRYHNKEKTDYILYSKSVNTKIKPEKGTTRGHIYVQGTLITKVPNVGTLVYTLSHVDMGGKVPSTLMGDTMVKQMTKKMLKQFKKKAEDYKSWQAQHSNLDQYWLQTVDWMEE